MKNLIIDFTGNDIFNKGFNGAGFGNVMYIIGYTCSLINNKLIPIFVKIDKNKNQKTYNDVLTIINYYNFNNFNINVLTNETLLQNQIDLPFNKNLNDNSNNTYVIKTHIKGSYSFFSSYTMIPCKELPISFKNYDYINNKFFNLFNQIKQDEKYIAINVRRGDKLNLKKWLITTQDAYFKFINDNLDKKIIFVSDDIQWCKENFNNYNNVLFNEYNENDKVLIDQFIMYNSYELIINSDCTFSHIPHLTKNNKIRKLRILVSKKGYEITLNNKLSRYNVIKNYYLKNNLLDECSLIGV